MIVCPAPSMLGEKGFKKQIAPPTDQTSTLKGRGPRGPKVFISCTKNIVEAWPRYFLSEKICEKAANRTQEAQQHVMHQLEPSEKPDLNKTAISGKHF